MTVAHHKPAFAKFWQSQMLHLPDCWNRKKKSSMTFHLGLALFQCQPRSLKLVQFGASVNFGTSHYNACSKTWSFPAASMLLVRQAFYKVPRRLCDLAVSP